MVQAEGTLPHPYTNFVYPATSGIIINQQYMCLYLRNAGVLSERIMID